MRNEKSTIFSFFVVFLKPLSRRSKPLRVKIALSLFSLSLQLIIQQQHVRTTTLGNIPMILFYLSPTFIAFFVSN